MKNLRAAKSKDGEEEEEADEEEEEEEECLRQFFGGITEKVPPEASTRIGEKEVNLKKNRYVNTLPYDHNRVTVEALGPSFYFNGSYLDSCTIATQGPLPSTVGDFYSVIWHLDVRLVLQLTKCEYAKDVNPAMLLRKSHPYWPDRVGVPTLLEELTARDSNGNELKLVAPPNDPLPKFTLTKMRETKVHDVIAREMRIEAENGVEKYFYQLHYEGWPNGGVPDNVQDLLDLAQLVTKLTEHFKAELNAAKVMMHCSGGVGRTGSFAVVQLMLAETSKGRSPEVTRLFKLVRGRRMLSVDNADQLLWLHRIAKRLRGGILEVRPPTDGVHTRIYKFVKESTIGVSIDF